MVYTLVSGTSGRKAVEVQVLSRAPRNYFLEGTMAQVDLIQRAGFTVVLVMVLSFIVVAIMLAATQPSRQTSALLPVNGLYKIAEITAMYCPPGVAPQCSGKLIVSSGEPTLLEAVINSDTTVRYETKEAQIYPNVLKTGMTGAITFKADTNIIATMVIAD